MLMYSGKVAVKFMEGRHLAVSGVDLQVVHVSPDMRKAYIGEATDQTANGKSIMAFNKSWRSMPIQSWSGGQKLAGATLVTQITDPQLAPVCLFCSVLCCKSLK